MSTPLPARPDLEWLRKRAKATLKQLRRTRPRSLLAEAQLAVAREHGFSSWRALKAHIDGRQSPAPEPLTEELVAHFLKRVGAGDRPAVAALLLERPGLVNAVGPHPFWGGRPQALHVAIEANRPDMVRLLLKAGADINGRNDEYLYWSPLLLTLHWKQPAVRRALLRRGARIGLVEALAMGDDRMVLRILKQGRSALPKQVPNGGSLLVFARTPKAIDRLLALGVSTDQKDHWGTNPVDAFSRLGPRGKPLVRYLLFRGLAAGPEAFARLNDRQTLSRLIRDDPAVVQIPAVLKGAVDFGHHALATWLLDLGADPNGRGDGMAHETPLHSAAWNGDRPMVELLLRYHADPTLLDRQYSGTAAGWARTSVEVTNNPRCAEIAELLQEAERRHS